MLKATDHGVVLESIKAGRAKCLELIDRLDRCRQPLRDALGELLHLHALMSRKLLGDDAQD